MNFRLLLFVARQAAIKNVRNMGKTIQRNPGRPTVLLIRLVLITAIAAGVAVLVGVVAMKMGNWPWLGSALVNRTSLLAVSVAIGSLAGLTLLAIFILRARPANEPRPGGQDGTALLEFALILPIALMLILLMVQSALLMAGNLCVHYSAFCAARAAIVVVPADYEEAGEPPNVVAGDDGKKMYSIKQAAVWALLPISSGSRDITADADADILAEGLVSILSSSVGEVPSWASNAERLARRLTYANQNTTVTLVGPEDDGIYGEHEDLKVTVNHTFYLGVPYAARIFSKFGGSGGSELVSLPGEYGIAIVAKSTLTNEGPQDFIDIDVLE